MFWSVFGKVNCLINVNYDYCSCKGPGFGYAWWVKRNWNKNAESQCVQNKLGKVEDEVGELNRIKVCKIRVFGFYSRYDGKLLQDFKKMGKWQNVSDV